MHISLFVVLLSMWVFGNNRGNIFGTKTLIKWTPQLKMVWSCPLQKIRELMILGQERRPRCHKTKTAITKIKAVQLRRNII